MPITLFAENLEQLDAVAKQIIKATLPHKKFAFYGDMGVGKTTLIKALSLQLGTNDVISSPTFSIVNEYHIDDKNKIYHFDFYRIEDEQEAYDMGYEEYFYSSDYCFIEWPERISGLIDDDVVRIEMNLEGNKRGIKILI